MTTEEIYAICKLIFPNKQVQFNGCDVIISWNYMGIFRRIWIEQHYDYILIDSVGRLPSWFTDKVNYSYTAGKEEYLKALKTLINLIPILNPLLILGIYLSINF